MPHANLLNWAHKNTPDRQNSARFRNSAKHAISLHPIVQGAGEQDRLEASQRPGRGERLLLLHREQHPVPGRNPPGGTVGHACNLIVTQGWHASSVPRDHLNNRLCSLNTPIICMA